MPYRSQDRIQIPSCSLPTLLFKSPTHALESGKACFLDANSPETISLTPTDLRLWSQLLALGLQQHHRPRPAAAQAASGRHARFKPGDRVLLFSESSVYYPVVFLGVAMAGGVFTGASPSFVERELVHQLKDSGAKYLLTSEKGLDVALKAAATVGLDGENIFIFNHDVQRASSPVRTRPSGSFNSPSHCTKLLASPEEAKVFQCQYYSATQLLSGTTGIPKGVEISHANYVSVVVQVKHFDSQYPPSPETAACRRSLNFMPMYHCMSQMINIGVALFLGHPVYIMPTFNLPRMISCIQFQKITNLLLTPAIVVAMIKSPSVKSANLSSVTSADCGSAPLSAITMKAFDRLWPPGEMTLAQVWGMTELTATAIHVHPKFRRESSTSVGKLLPNCEAKIVDPVSRQEIKGHGSNVTGELMVRGPNVMKGYWRNPAATREVVGPDGWLRTGDIAFVDDKERFHIVDRSKELIKVTGGQLAPAEMESVLLAHPAVAQAAVVGVVARARAQGPVQPGDEVELAKAYVVLLPDERSQRLKEKDLLQFVEKNVIAYKRLDGGLVFVKAIPKGPSGKILRAQVEQWAASGDRAIPKELVRGQEPRTRSIPMR